jgi:triacylglycerol lipase
LLRTTSIRVPTARDNLRKLVQSKAPTCKELLITGHSLGGVLSALSAPDLLNNVAAHLAPIVYTSAEPRVGHSDFVRFFDTHLDNVSFVKFLNLIDYCIDASVRVEDQKPFCG